MRYVLLGILMTACTDKGDDSTGGTTDSGTTDSGGVSDTGDTGEPDTPSFEPRRCSGFSDTPEVWALESKLVANYFMYSMDGLGQYWSLFDLTGDGRPDLIHHAHGNVYDADAAGDVWYVWPSEGDRFGGRIAWQLPVDHRDLDGIHTANSVEGVLDITGDGYADLVRARDPQTGTAYGSEGDPRWEVYPGDGATGFATTPTLWDLPDDLKVPTEIHEGGTHDVRDIDGDGAVELIRTTDNTGENYASSDGSLHWRVYEVDGDGFAAEYREWSLPEARSVHGDYESWVDSAYKWHTTQDVTGDGLPDLVLPRTLEYPYPVYGDEPDWHWRVHVNTGDGFASEHREWSVPDPAFDFPAGQADTLYPVSQDWRTLSIGDGAPVLVISHDFEDGTPFVEGDETIWAIFDQTGEGFADQHAPWSLPDDVFSTFWSISAHAESWLVSDMDGDGCSDLVLTTGLGLDASVTGDGWVWWIYKGQ